MKFSRSILLTVLTAVILLFPLLGREAAADDYAALRQSYQQLSQTPQLQRQRGNWERLLARFDAFIARNPLHSQLEKALFLQARTWDGLSKASGRTTDAEEAIRRYLAMAERFPGSHLADDALFHAGQASEYRLRDRVAARLYYQRLVVRMPSGDMVAEAQKRLAALPAPVVQAAPSGLSAEHNVYHSVGEPPQLERIRFWSGPEYTRVVLDMNAPAVAKPHYLKGEHPRLYFDLLYTRPAAELPALVPIRNGLVGQVRSSLFDEQRTRVVLDLDRVAEYRLTTLENPHRLVVDILGAPERTGSADHPSGTDKKNTAADDSIADILNSAADRQPALHLPQENKEQGIHLIVVDAGHGGRDPGAIGPNKVMEKDVTLKMAKALAAALKQKMGVKVLLTRSDDRYLELRERTDYANRVGADLFISLHANASPRGQALRTGNLFPQPVEKQSGGGSGGPGKTASPCRKWVIWRRSCST